MSKRFKQNLGGVFSVNVRDVMRSFEFCVLIFETYFGKLCKYVLLLLYFLFRTACARHVSKIKYNMMMRLSSHCLNKWQRYSFINKNFAIQLNKLLIHPL